MDIQITKGSKDYELLDSGEGQKLERYGEYVLARPDTQAIWGKKLGIDDWAKADAVFSHGAKSGKWNIKTGMKENWYVSLNDVIFSLSLLPSKHLGVFPEQSSQWSWIEEKIRARISPEQSKQPLEASSGRMTSNKSNKAPATTVSVLNLFGYTGGASLVSAKAGADVVHVDSSKFAVDLAKKNLKDSGINDKSVRFIVDDVRKFVEREIKRGNKYDVILMDPPVYGKGVKKEVWKIETDLAPFLSKVKMLFTSKPLAVVLNGYASVYSAQSYKNLIQDAVKDLGGEIEWGELSLEESSGRLLPCGIYSRWSK